MIDIFYLNGELKKAELKDLDKLKNRRIWIDTTSITQEESEALGKAFSLHPLTIEDLSNFPTRIKTEEFPNYLFCVFYGITKSRTVELIELDFILGKNFIITNHKKDIASFHHLKEDKRRLTTLLKKGCDYIFYWLLDMEIDNYFPVLEEIDDHIEDIEEKVTAKPRPEILSRIMKLKHLVVYIKKTAFHQREKLSFVAKNDSEFISSGVKPYFRDVYDHAIRVSDLMDSYREGVANCFEVYMSSVSNNMNEVMKVLSVVSTIALPMTVISSIYGTNFSHLPGSEQNYGFWIMIGVMVVICLFMVHYFRKRGWL